jgi:hypothetical protein
MTTQPAVTAYGAYNGLPGAITRYFWVQAIYPSGRSVVSNLVTISSAGSLSNQNQITISWRPQPGASGYDVLETPTSSAPSVSSTTSIGVALGVTGNVVVLSNEPTLQSWTYQTGNGGLTVGSTTIGSGVSNTVLYQDTGGLLADDLNFTYDPLVGLGVPAIITTGAITGGGKITSAAGIQSRAVAVTATTDGLTTGIIPDDASVVTVTSSANTKLVTLPTPTPGVVVQINIEGTGYNLRSSTPASVGINGGTGASAKSAVSAKTLVCRCVSATAWVVTTYIADGTAAALAAAS